jgi:endoglucanase
LTRNYYDYLSDLIDKIANNHKIIIKVLAMLRNLLIKTLFSILLSCLSYGAFSGPVTKYGQLQVQGNKITSLKTGQPVQLKGFSTHGLQWFPYVTGEGGTVENMVDGFGVQIIRLAMYVHERSGAGGNTIAGYLGESPNIYEDQVRPLILDAIANDIYVVVDWHLHWNPASEQNKQWTPSPYTEEAKNFFTMVAEEFGNHPNIIYEIMNEPGQFISWQQVKNHAIPVYNEIRAIDSDNLILVPTPSFSQNILDAANDPIVDGDTINGASNIAYTMHFYAQSHNFRDRADQALSQGIAIFVSEWGMSDYSGDGDIDTSENGSADLWVDWMRDRNISWLAWNFANKSETSSALKAYENDNINNEWQWTQNILKEGVPMQSGPWTDSVISDSGKWIRSRILEGQACVENCPPVGVIEAENYLEMVGIKIEMTQDSGGGENIGYIDPGDWMTYAVNVPSSGSYTINYRVASLTGGSFQFEKAGGDVVYGQINVPATGNWQTWQTISHTVNLVAGQQNVALASLDGAWNVNWFEIINNEQPLIDSDNDGIVDGDDQCVDTLIGAEVDSIGCEILVTIDSDSDGIIDNIDQCPGTSIGIDVDSIGCEIFVTSDIDNDGIVDDNDQCANTLIDTEVDSTGCEIIAANSCLDINTYPNWTANDWQGTPNTHNNNGDLMQVDGNAYSANWYTSSVPGSDASWTFVKACN